MNFLSLSTFAAAFALVAHVPNDSFGQGSAQPDSLAPLRGKVCVGRFAAKQNGPGRGGVHFTFNTTDVSADHYRKFGQQFYDSPSSNPAADQYDHVGQSSPAKLVSGGAFQFVTRENFTWTLTPTGKPGEFSADILNPARGSLGGEGSLRCQ